MQARVTAYPPEQAAIVCTARLGERMRIGRAQDNDLHLEHASVSRVHAELPGFDTGWQLRDLDSKNGTFVDDRPAEVAALDRACRVRFGEVHCAFDLLSDADLSAEVLARAARHTAATAHAARLEHLVRFNDLLDASLGSVLELSQCERGFLLLADGDDFIVRSSQVLNPSTLSDRALAGTVGAVRRALERRRPVVANDVAHDTFLATHGALPSNHPQALLCVPLCAGDRTLGAIYADRTIAGPAITMHDLELLQAFAEHAALWIAARHATEAALREADIAPRWSRIVASQGEDA